MSIASMSFQKKKKKNPKNIYIPFFLICSCANTICYLKMTCAVHVYHPKFSLTIIILLSLYFASLLFF